MIKKIWKSNPDSAVMIVLSLFTMMLALSSIIFTLTGMVRVEHIISLFISTTNVYLILLLARYWYKTDRDLRKRQAEDTRTPEEKEQTAVELSRLTGIPKKEFLISIKKRRREMSLLLFGAILANLISLTTQFL